ncbi:EAL domain-containing protein [Exiguobacterium aurantiacum]|uniref:Putative diguanylate cyclase n=1 Tax=Exiguobacterium aurantiacum TaxID=33987 RepID=A0A377FQE9_9BACL|nr:EAL domain-containing protein [Exiguobacterium aurantiacum]STO07061.1 putative diguanylate cyclase [Exiguobacterium aurantiacum]
MWSPCVACSTTIPFFERGLLVVNEQPHPYESFDELTQKLAVVEEEVYCVDPATNRQTAAVPAIDLLEQIANRDTIELIQHGEFESHLQPIIHLDTGERFGYEALLRSRNDISPGELFRAANRFGLHSKLDQRARAEAIKATHHAVLPHEKTFINFLPSTIYNPDYCLQHTFEVIDRYNLSPERFIFEVVETEKVQDVAHLQHVFSTYKKRGMKVALDDVGAGFSTLDMLKRLEPDYVKIDRSYVSFCDQDTEKRAFLKNVRQLTRSMGITLLAEGVERIEEVDVCRELGFDLAQGYYFGKPSPYAL